MAVLPTQPFHGPYEPPGQMSARVARLSAIVAVLLVAIGAAVALARWSTRVTPSPKPAPLAAAAAKIDILGLEIGDSIEEAREKLDPLRDPSASEATEMEGGEEEGIKAFWPLKDTEYRWVMVWANTAERIVAIHISVRPERLKPFSEIGPLTETITHRPEMAAWNVKPARGLPYRVIAKGAHEQANVIYITSSSLDVR